MFNIVTLPNKITVVTEEIPFIHSIAFGCWVKNGARNETADTNGISHFIEHMLFKGTESRSAKQIADEMDAVGGQLNAYTTKEYTCYYARTLDTHLDTALAVITDMLFHSRFDETDIKKERQVIMEEIDMYEDTPEELVHELLEANVFRDDTLGHAILGSRESISAFSRQTFLDYMENNYCPENIVIALAGHFKHDDILKKIETYFGGFTRPRPYVPQTFHSAYKPCVITKEKDIEQAHLSIGFPSIPIGTEEAYALSALNTLFGGGMSSRLFQSVREEHGLAYSIYSYNASYIDTGIFSIYAALNTSQLQACLTLIFEEIDKLFTEKITEAQLERTKEQLKSNYLMSLESSNSRMSSIGRSQLMLDRILSPDELIEKVDAVTPKRLDDMIKKIFDKNNLSLSAVGKLNGFDFENALQALR